MTRKIDLSYIAGLMDGEAYIGVKKSKAGERTDRTSPGYHARIQIRMVDEAAIRFIAETLGGWYYKEKPHCAKGRPLYCYQATDKKAETILRALLPYLRVKRASAETVLALRETQAEGRNHRTKITGYRDFHHWTGRKFRIPNKSFSDEFVARLDGFYERCKELNRVGI